MGRKSPDSIRAAALLVTMVDGVSTMADSQGVLYSQTNILSSASPFPNLRAILSELSELRGYPIDQPPTGVVFR